MLENHLETPVKFLPNNQNLLKFVLNSSSIEIPIENPIESNEIRVKIPL